MKNKLLEKIDVSTQNVLSREEQKNIVGGQWVLTSYLCLHDDECPYYPSVGGGFCYQENPNMEAYCFMWYGNGDNPSTLPPPFQ